MGSFIFWIEREGDNFRKVHSVRANVKRPNKTKNFKEVETLFNDEKVLGCGYSRYTGNIDDVVIGSRLYNYL